jgi:hypothetical protein
MNGKTVDTVSIPSTAGAGYTAVFDNLNLDLSEGDKAEFEVLVDLNKTGTSGATFATGTTLYATTTGSDSNWDVEDAQGDAVTPSGSVNNSSDTLVFQTEGISVKFVSSSATKTFTAGAVAGQKDVGTFKIVVDVTAVGDDMYLDNSVSLDPNRDGSGTAGDGFLVATTTNSTTGTTTPVLVVSASDTNSGDTTGAGGHYKINEGTTRRFTVSVDVQAGTNGVAAVQLTGINFTSDANDTTADNFYNSNMGDFKTDLLSLYIQ